jgi:2,4-dienoyl-CoA reductase-like NADH-dependent reductase (Old Yellow Enzyme family)
MTTRRDSIAFRPGRLGGLETKNRLIRSATYENAAAASGEVTEQLLDMYRALARGGVGTIITGASSVHPNGLAPPRMFRADNDSFLPSLKKLTEAVHGVGNGCKVILQLNHPGRQIRTATMDLTALPALPPSLAALLKKKKPESPSPRAHHPEVEPVAPSALYDPFFHRTPRALTMEEVEGLIVAFAAAIGRAREAGFDGVQLHAAHGWLLSSFLSPHTNSREDRYGGCTANRARIITEICERARVKVGSGFPILVKMNTTDFVSGGLEMDEAAEIGFILANTGICAIETSGGTREALTRPEEELGWKPYLVAESRTGITSKDQKGHLTEMGVKSASIVYSTKEGTTDLAHRVGKGLSANKTRVVMHPFEPSINDFKPVINKIKMQERPEIIVMICFENDYVGILRAAKVMKPDVKAMYGAYAIATPKMLAKFPDLVPNV